MAGSGGAYHERSSRRDIDPMRGALALLLVLLLPCNGHADTLTEAMADAMASNPDLAAHRHRLRATREALPQAWAEALPQVSVTAEAVRDDRDGDGQGVDTPSQESWHGAARGSQLIFGSGRVLASTRAARAQIRAAVADYDLASQTLLLEVTQTYADLRYAQAALVARETSVSNLTALSAFTEAQFEAGVVTRTDIAQTRARLARARTQLVEAQGGLAASTEAYLRLVGRPPTALEAPPMVDGLPRDLQSALDLAVRQSPLLRATSAAVDVADAQVEVAAAQGRARVTFEASREVDEDFSDDASETTSDRIGLRVTLPLLQGGLTRSRTRQQQSLRAAARLDLTAAQRAVHEAVTTAWSGLANARAGLSSAHEQNEAAALAYEGVRLELETGLRSTVEVLDQEQALLEAHLALANAQRNVVIAERRLLAVLGGLGGAVADR